jgi:hypothetical protein
MALVMVFGLGACGGKKKKKAAKKVTFREVSHFGVTMKIPSNFTKSKGSGKFAHVYVSKGMGAAISIEKGDQYKEGGMEKLYAEQYEKRSRKTQKRFKSKDAYKIIHKKDMKMGSRAAFEVEQEFRDQDGSVKAHSIEINVDIGDGKLLTLRWKVNDVDSDPWDKYYDRYFKESHGSVNFK